MYDCVYVCTFQQPIVDELIEYWLKYTLCLQTLNIRCNAGSDIVHCLKTMNLTEMFKKYWEKLAA